MAKLFLVPGQAVPAPGTTPDAEDRAMALDIGRSFLVEAPAGSGKTGLLIQRFLKLLASPSVETPAQVLAITFTRQATAEMRDRVWHQLAAARDVEAGETAEPANAFDRATLHLAAAALARDRQRGWGLLDDPRQLNIRTIDSVCADIARGLPVLSGSGGGLAPTENAGTLHHEAARRTTMLLGGEDAALDAALRLVLLHRDGNLADLETLIAEMLGWRDQWGDLIPLTTAQLNDTYLDEVVLPRLDNALDLAVCQTLTRLTHIIPAETLKRLCLLAAQMSHSEGYDGNDSPVALCAGRHMPPAEKSAHVDHWRALIALLLTKDGTFRKPKGVHKGTMKFMIEPAHKAELAEIIDELRGNEPLREALCSLDTLPPALYPREAWPVAKALFRTLSRALVELQLVFAERSVCDFTEMALLARTALEREGALDDLRDATGHALQHLLVDEMQDTSTSQYELIRLLTQRWDGHSQTVFLVGDPKQSIYLFRQARVERFIHTMHAGHLGTQQDALPLSVLHLTANFRSQRVLVEDFNTVFGLLFPSRLDPTRPERVPYRPAAAVRESTPAAAQVWHINPLAYTADRDACRLSKRLQAHRDAVAIRGILEDWRSRPLPSGRTQPWKLAILVNSRGHLAEIVRTLKAAPAIPYRAIKTEPLGERQEILDLLSLTRALLHPADRTAWLALLRTPWCGLQLADLLQLAGQDDYALRHTPILTLIEQRGHLLSEDGIAQLQPFWHILSAALAQRGCMPLARWVERTWRAFHAHLFASAEELANIDRFFRLLDTIEAEGDGPLGTVALTTLEARLAGLYAAPALHADAVDLMTIHGAKGLEWDVVLVPALERSGRNGDTRLLSWLEKDAVSHESDGALEVAHGILAPISSKGVAAGELNDWMRSIDKARESAERTRLFYVACTRAREELHLFAAPERNKDGTIKRTYGSLLATAWPAAAQHFDAPSALSPTLPAPPSAPPQRDEWGDDSPSLALAASANEPAPEPIQGLIQRIPPGLIVMPAVATPLMPEHVFDRPEGSFAARVFGNTLHAFLEALTRQIGRDRDAETLLAELPSWASRVSTVLRAGGLAKELTTRFTANVLQGLANTLQSEDGRWLLAVHPQAGVETVYGVAHGESMRRVRLDRTFLAGSTPTSRGSTHLWIVDYKTASHGQTGLAAFLDEEQARYREQLENYARALSPQAKPIRVALFYPMVAALRWWEPAMESAQNSSS